MEGVAERLASVRERISRAGRDWRSITVVAVTKGVRTEAVAEAYEAGLRDFGENYAHALMARTDRAGERWQAAPPRWHYLGAVQRKKVRRLAPYVSVWQGVDRVAEGAEIARHAPGASVMVQVNVSGLGHRNGCMFEEVPALVDGLRGHELDVRGLMGMAEPHDPRAGFARLAWVARDVGVAELSMGMSDDFEIAVQEGSTMVRVGTALFGPRPAHRTGDRLDSQGGF